MTEEVAGRWQVIMVVKAEVNDGRTMVCSAGVVVLTPIVRYPASLSFLISAMPIA
jgi:hypothetical protein